MKSVLITIIMFAVALGAIYLGLFNIMSSSYMYTAAGFVLIISLGFALKVLGNPFAKDGKNDKHKL